MREIAWIEREGGGPVRVRDRVRIDTHNYRAGGVDRFEFEFEFEFGSTHNYRAGGVDRFEFEFEFGSTTQLSSRGGVDRFEFEFEFGSTTQLP